MSLRLGNIWIKIIHFASIATVILILCHEELSFSELFKIQTFVFILIEGLSKLCSLLGYRCQSWC